MQKIEYHGKSATHSRGAWLLLVRLLSHGLDDCCLIQDREGSMVICLFLCALQELLRPGDSKYASGVSHRNQVRI